MIVDSWTAACRFVLHSSGLSLHVVIAAGLNRSHFQGALTMSDAGGIAKRRRKGDDTTIAIERLSHTNYNLKPSTIKTTKTLNPEALKTHS